MDDLTLKSWALTFLAEHLFATISSVNDQGKPQSAFVGYSNNDNFEFLIGTSSLSRKYKNISVKDTVSLVIADTAGELQLEGVAAIIDDAGYQRLTSTEGFRDLPGYEHYRNDPNQVFFKITPTWLRLINHQDKNKTEEYVFKNKSVSDETSLVSRFKLKSAVYLLLEKDDQILLSRRSNTNYHDGKLSLVCGHLDGGEVATAAMTREAKEEINIDVKANDLVFVHAAHRINGDEEYVDFFYRCNNWSGEIINREQDKCSELVWTDRDNLPSDVIPFVKNILKDIKTGVAYSEYAEEPV